MKYCEEDIKKARQVIDHIRYGADTVKMCIDCIRMSEDEKMIAYNAYDILKNIIRYGDQLEDDKLKKLIRMKMIIKEGCE